MRENSSNNNLLDVSNLSQVQKELKPNKIVNKGNSVFSNQHKMMMMQNEIITEGNGNNRFNQKSPNDGGKEFQPRIGLG